MAEPSSHQAPGKETAAPEDEPTAVYEIRLQGTLAASLRRQFPTAAVVTTRTETVLYRQVARPAELDALIAQVLSLGLVLTEVHQVLDPSDLVAAHGQQGSPR
jgi:hypothetical protein